MLRMAVQRTIGLIDSARGLVLAYYHSMRGCSLHGSKEDPIMSSTRLPRSNWRLRWPLVLVLLVALGALSLGPLLVSASPPALQARRGSANSMTECLDSLGKLQKDRTYLTNVLKRVNSQEAFLLLLPVAGAQFE